MFVALSAANIKIIPLCVPSASAVNKYICKSKIENILLPCFGDPQEIPQQSLAHRRHNRFRMKLDAFGGMRMVPKTHDFAVIRFGSDGQTIRKINF